VVDELEAALHARWDRDTLLVYADALQAAGNPRGELIALDLELADSGWTHEVATRRRKCLYDWLGGSTLLDRPWHEASFRDGFATDFDVGTDGNHDGAEYLEALFASPAGPYVRGLTIRGGRPDDVREVLEVLIRARRPWLERLSIDILEHGAAIPRALPGYVIESTPRLQALALTGVPAFAAFPHPGVRRLATASGGLAIAPSLPDLETLDLVLGRSDCEDNETGFRLHIVEMLHAIPTLRHLDLARTEPGYPRHRPLVDVYPLVRWLPDHVRSVRLPALREPDQVAALGAAIEHARSLEVTIARAYRSFAHVWQDVGHDRLHLPVPFWWPSRETTSSREALSITLPTEEYGDDLSLVSLIDLLEAQFETLPAAVRAAWRDFWEFVDDLPWEDAGGKPITRPFPAATLLTAVEPLDDIRPSTGEAGGWAQLAEKLRAAELPGDAAVSIRRYWGW
jgi:hypothetical protein